MTDLVQFHQRGGLWFAFLGVHVVALARDTGEWMSCLDGDVTWRRRTDLSAAKLSIAEHIRQWYDAAHQPLAAGQAERLCELPRQAKSRQKEVIKINAIDLEPVALRLKRDGVVTTYVLPPVEYDGDGLPQVNLAQLRMYCVSAAETFGHKARAAATDGLALHEAAVFAGLVRLIDGCVSSDVIKRELLRIAREREAARLESQAETDPAEAEGAPA